MMTGKHLALTSLILLAPPLLAARAGAEEPKNPGASPRQGQPSKKKQGKPSKKQELAEAQLLVDKGKAKFAARSFSEAVASFEAALQIVRSPETLLYVAHCYRELGYEKKAIKHYELVQTEWEKQHPNTPSPHADEAAQAVQAIKLAISKRAADAKRRQQAAEAKRKDAEWERKRVAEAKRARLAKAQAARQKRRRVYTIGLAAGGGLAVSGLIMGLSFNAAADRVPGDSNSTRPAATTGFIIAGVSAAAALTSAVLYLLAGSSDESAEPAAAAVGPLPGGAAVSASLRF